MADDYRNWRDKELITPRMQKRRDIKAAGRRSAAAAHALMLMPDAALGRLDLDDELIAAFLKARDINHVGARRREERRLAGVLRLGDLDEMEEKLASQEKSGKADGRMFKQAEAWRTRLLTDGAEALEAFHQAFPEQERQVLDKMFQDACREDVQGKPKGAKKALFRHIAGVLKA
jgi:ribosome-associated protein